MCVEMYVHFVVNFATTIIKNIKYECPYFLSITIISYYLEKILL